MHPSVKGESRRRRRDSHHYPPPLRSPQASVSTTFLKTILVVSLVLVFTTIFIPNAGPVETKLFGNLDPLNDVRNAKAAIEKEAENAEHRLRHAALKKKAQVKNALDKLSTGHMLSRLKALREAGQIVGERLVNIQEGTETVPELLHPNMDHARHGYEGKPPMELSEIMSYLENWFHSLHDELRKVKQASFEEIWQAYHDLTVHTLYVWDQDYLSRMPRRRQDDNNSIFLSVATYRDENCINTLNWAYGKAKNPSSLFVGLVQQNCHKDCKTGVLESGEVEDMEPDQDCFKAFCDGPMKAYCGNIRVLNIDEAESLGPYAARYFASKLWYGEQWFMQIDAHMTFAQDWDASSVMMLQAAPSKKPIISHYPPSHTVDLEAIKDQPGSRLCGPIFATSESEAQIIRLEGGEDYDKVHLDIPRFGPFTAAGYFVAHSDILREVPFDPFLPWIFMGEEVIMSTRLWTSGYDIFSPTHSVLGHMYGRANQPNFWTSIDRTFDGGVGQSLEGMVLDRIKYQLGYPESAKDMLRYKSLLTAVEQYSMGKERPLSWYLDLVGLDMTSKEVTFTRWCEYGTVPPGFEHFAHLYETKP